VRVLGVVLDLVVLVGHLELLVDVLVDLGLVDVREGGGLVDLAHLNQLLLLLQHHHLMLHHQNLLVDLLLGHVGAKLRRVLHERELWVRLRSHLLVLVKVGRILI